MRSVVIALLCFFSVAIQAEVYKWVDDKGVVHYGDKHNADKLAVEMDVDDSSPEADSKPGQKDSVSREEKRQRVSDAMEEDRLEKKADREKKKSERERNKRRCNQLKDKMARTKKAAGVYKLDKDGNRVFMSAEQRTKNEKRISNQMKKYCR